MDQDFNEILTATGAELQRLTERERWDSLQQWREVFAARLHERTGKWKHGDFEWHVFTFGETRSISGEKAVLKYEQQEVSRFYVVPERALLGAYLCTGGKLPAFRPLLEDIYVWPEDLSWTMAFTHEMDIWFGPYFCLREWVS